MDKQTIFHGKSVAIDLACVMAFERPRSMGIAGVLGQRRNLSVTLIDGSDVLVEDDADSFIAAIDRFLELD